MVQREPAARIEASLPMNGQECVRNGPRRVGEKTAGYSGLLALVSIVLPGSMISVESVWNPARRKALSTNAGVRHTASGLSKILMKPYVIAEISRTSSTGLGCVAFGISLT